MSAAQVLTALAARGQSVATAESLTGGQLAAALTEAPGASAAYVGGVVSYATYLKARLLGVPDDLLAERGAVDPDVAAAMAQGVRERCGATYGLATTGVAGPEPQDGKSPGLVYVAVAGPDGVTVEELCVDGERAQVQAETVARVLGLLAERLSAHG